MPVWLVVLGAVVLLAAAIGGGFTLGAVRAGADLAAAPEDPAGDSGDGGGTDGGGAPGSTDAEESAGETGGPEGAPGGGAMGIAGGQDLSGYGISYQAPGGWEPTDELPAPMSLEMDGPEIVHALTRDDGTVVAFTSLTYVNSRAGGAQGVTTADTATYLRTFVGPLNEGFRDGGSRPHEVEGSTDATRVDMGFGEVSVVSLIVDTGTADFAVLSVGHNQAASPTPEEFHPLLLDAIPATVTVL
ncbi:hypothetical protein AB0I72_03575 [Nocardiopsis sp. NPDC049922]|uniref:hypothetical protein n=1 Tax=Nocardiopsis sp. NPDC049922 TaxID=3155157 RepID=UPI0033F70CA2